MLRDTSEVSQAESENTSKVGNEAMRKILSFLSQEEVFIIVVTVAILGLSLAPLVYEVASISQIPADRVFTLDHNFLPDYNAYLSRMRQGVEGGWLVYERFTSEPHQGSLLQVFYLLLGKAGWLFRVGPEVTYLVARIGLGAGWFLLAYVFLRQSLESGVARRVAFVFLAFSGGIIERALIKGEWVWLPGLSGWSQLDVIKRATFLPHFLAGHILFLLTLLLFWRFQKKPSRFGVAGAAILALATGFILPQMVMLAGVVMAGMMGVDLWRRRGELKETFWQQFPFFATYVLVSGLVLFYFFRVTQAYPWLSLSENDIAAGQPFPFLAYFKALGATFLLAILGALVVLWQKKEKAYPALFWALAAFGFLLAFDRFLGYNQRRFIEVGVELPLSLLAAVFLAWLARLIWKRRETLVLAFLAGLVLIPGMITNYVSLSGQFQFVWERVHASWPLVPFTPYVIYPVRDWMEVIWWLRDNSQNSDIVLAEDTAGNFIPAHAGNAVYIGHGAQTVKYPEKRVRVQAFFKGEMSQEQARRFLEKESISYVFWGVEERELGDFVTRLPYLTPVYQGPTTTLYRVDL